MRVLWSTVTGWNVQVESIGTVYQGSLEQARRVYRTYVYRSRIGTGKVRGKHVRLLSPEGEPEEEYFPSLEDEDELSHDSETLE